MIVLDTTIKGLKKDASSVRLVNRVLIIQVKNSFLSDRLGATKILSKEWTAGLSPRAKIELETTHGLIVLDVSRAEYTALAGGGSSFIERTAQTIRTALGCSSCKK